MQKAINLKSEQKECFANELLVYMKNELENNGATIKTFSFDFHLSRVEKYFGDTPDEEIPEGDDLTNLKKIINISDAEFSAVMNYCMTHQFVHRFCCGQVQFDSLQLTEDGFARAT